MGRICAIECECLRSRMGASRTDKDLTRANYWGVQSKRDLAAAAVGSKAETPFDSRGRDMKMCLGSITILTLRFASTSFTCTFPLRITNHLSPSLSKSATVASVPAEVAGKFTCVLMFC